MTNQTRARTVAVLSGNPAFGALVGREIQQSGNYRVPIFATIPALSTFLRIAPVDVIVLSDDARWDDVVETVRALKRAPANANPLLEVIVVTHALPLVHDSKSDIFAVLTKPIPSGKLVEAIESVLTPHRPQPHKPVRSTNTDRTTRPARPPSHRELVSNVIPLFGRTAGKPTAPR
ncbi:MAG: hypothetical protein ABI992_00235 [Chthoniobacterales bacterium]